VVTRLESRNFVTPVDLGVVQSEAIMSLLTIHNRLWEASSQHCSDRCPTGLLPQLNENKLTIAMAMN